MAVRHAAGADGAPALWPYLAGRRHSCSIMLVGGYPLLASVQPYFSDHQASSDIMRRRSHVDFDLLRALRKPEIHQTDRSASDRQLESRNKDRHSMAVPGRRKDLLPVQTDGART